MLAALVVGAPLPVSTDRLIEEIWQGSPPASAINLVQGYVASLRRALGDADGQLLRTQAPGYQLVLPPEELDVGRLESLTDQGKRALAGGRSRIASDLLAEALRLWRGQPFTDVVTTGAVAAETARLEQLRLAALEARIDADLNLGRHGDLVPELQALTEAHPLLERFWGQLMLALYRSGRQAEALDAY
ncbi:MAG TPA: AfsR/SARP family transcriptional regulator, partial [Mycobacterium sp.]